MARLPSGKLIQLRGNQVEILEENGEEVILSYNTTLPTELQASQNKIEALNLDDDDKMWAHFWAGYFMRSSMIQLG